MAENTKTAVQNNDRIEIDLVEVFGLLLSRLWILILSGLTTAIAAFLICYFMITPLYQSTTSVYILNRQNEDKVTYSDTQLATQLTKDYEELVTSRYVLEKVIDQLTLEDDYTTLSKRVSVSNKTDTRIISISVKDPDPKQAQLIANAIRDCAAEHIKQVMDIEAVNIVDEANLPVKPVEPSKRRWVLMGGMLGALLAAAFVLLQYLLDDSIKTSDDVEKYLGLSTLALIPVIHEQGEESRSRKSRRVVRSKSQAAEQEKTLEYAGQKVASPASPASAVQSESEAKDAVVEMEEVSFFTGTIGEIPAEALTENAQPAPVKKMRRGMNRNARS